MIKEIRDIIKFSKMTDRIGPDIIGTYWRLFFSSKMKKLCQKKFLFFSETAEFRPGAYAVGCSQISIGERVVIRPGTMLHGESISIRNSIIIEDDVLMGSGVHIYVENHSFSNPNISIIDQGHSDGKQVLIKKGAWIGANSIILPGITIGENSVIGAGSVVTKSIPRGVVAAGNPARIIKYLE
jgi:acetyltransferase-like isoleucine patch superfamily enzyme